MNEIRSRAARFSRSWKDEPGDERQQAQPFVRDLLGVYGITETRAAFYEKRARAAFYEKRVKRSSTGSRGYIDALKLLTPVTRLSTWVPLRLPHRHSLMVSTSAWVGAGHVRKGPLTESIGDRSALTSGTSSPSRPPFPQLGWRGTRQL